MDDLYFRQLRAAYDDAIRNNEKRMIMNALIGNGAGVVQTGRENYVFVRLLFGESVQVAEALSYKISVNNDQPVRVRYNIDDVLEVIDYDVPQAIGYFAGSGVSIALAGPHAPSHGLYADDPAYLSRLQIDGLQTRHTATNPPSVTLSPYYYVYGGQSYAFTGATMDLSSYLPTGLNEQRPVLVGLNAATGSPQVVAGSPQVYIGLAVNSNPFTVSDLAGLYDADFIPSAAVRLRRNQDAIYAYDLITDVRQWSIAAAHTADPSTIEVILATTPLLEDQDSTDIYAVAVGARQIALYDGAAWRQHEWLGTPSVSLGSTSDGLAYTAFAQLVGTVPTVFYEAGTPIALQDGVAVYDADATARFLGSFYIESGGTVLNTLSRRHIEAGYPYTERVLAYSQAGDYTLAAATAPRNWGNNINAYAECWAGFESYYQAQVEARSFMRDVGGQMFGTVDVVVSAPLGGSFSEGVDRAIHPKWDTVGAATASVKTIVDTDTAWALFRFTPREIISDGASVDDLNVSGNLITINIKRRG